MLLIKSYFQTSSPYTFVSKAPVFVVIIGLASSGYCKLETVDPIPAD